MGGECQVSFGICIDEDKGCLEEYPLRWIGWKEGEGVKQVAKAGVPDGESNFSVLHLDNMVSTHKPDLHRYPHMLSGSNLPQGVPGIEDYSTGFTRHSRDEAKTGKEGT